MNTTRALLLCAVVFGVSGCTARMAEVPKSWSAIHDGMTRQEVYAAVGPADWSDPEQHHTNGVETLASEHWVKQVGAGELAGLSVSYGGDGRVTSVGHTRSKAAK